MIKCIRITSSVPAALIDEIVSIAAENVHELSMSHVPRASVFYPLYKSMMEVEVGLYLSAIGTASYLKGEVIVAVDDSLPNKVVGFLLYMVKQGVTGQCGVNYVAVKEGFRRRGFFTSMMAEMSRYYAAASLTCPIKLVPVYERLGFKVVGSRETQVIMDSGTSPQAKVRVINMDSLSDHPLIKNQQHELMSRLGPTQVQFELEAFTMDVMHLTTAAEEYVISRQQALLRAQDSSSG